MSTTVFTDGVTLTAAAWFNDVDSTAYSVLTGVAGTNTITATGPANYTYGATRTPIAFIPANTNTGATTINLTCNSIALGAKNVFWNGAACVGGELRQNVPAALAYDGTQFHIIANGFNAPFLDTHAIVEGSADSTKKVRIEADGITTATTRVWTAPDFDFTLGAVVQRAYQEYLSSADLSTAIPNDDTIPQNNEGTEIMTQAITPKSASNRIRVTFQGQIANGTAGGQSIAALFVDTTADALAASVTWNATATAPVDLTLSYEASAGSTSARTYKIRAGGHTGQTVRFNGQTSGRLLGGVSRATMIVEEIS